MIRICLATCLLAVTAAPLYAQGIEGSGEVVTDTLEALSVTATNQPVISRQIVRTGRDGRKTQTESLSSPLAVAETAQTLPVLSTLRTTVRNRDSELDLLEIIARAGTITETATPDGTTRIIRIIPEGGQGTTLITITKD
ncbi:MAG: hypothetical protein KJ871_14475 [Alphaproteobacteria bacterium]|nr:hypothetical protein [Alphaproteobacteria bacterium]MBU2085564.1 hypothetical protein [Alphaproteobacteria bacterium]MBU2141686.1 hypothetical protein [Alphaproteobacteria bacterium]MBU2197649.1 hypothetical protein [Alphaproteobacteria bacterium]